MRRRNDDASGCLAMVLIGVFLMPIVGVYLMVKGEDDSMKVLGTGLTIVGVILWIGVALQ